jgi:hypothetical protein
VVFVPYVIAGVVIVFTAVFRPRIDDEPYDEQHTLAEILRRRS